MVEIMGNRDSIVMLLEAWNASIFRLCIFLLAFISSNISFKRWALLGYCLYSFIFISTLVSVLMEICF